MPAVVHQGAARHAEAAKPATIIMDYMAKKRAVLERRLQVIREAREARRERGLYDAVPTVPALFRHRDVLVTGGSGFLGRVLVEKLLRSCPDVGNVFLLLRPKKGVAPAERLHDVVDVPLFDQLRREQPGALAKLVAVAGDCSELGLGLGDEDRALLQDRVAVVFHGAASVRFDDPVQKAVLLNTRGCRELVELCAGMRQLQALVHISTAFTNTNQAPIQEKLYSTDFHWRDAIQYASDPSIAEVLQTLGPKILGFHPNTYTFSKALGEQVMGDASSFLPIVVVRPAIVVGAVAEPLPGWLDNVNSPAALWMAFNKGVIRMSPMCSADVKLDYVPVDLIAKATVLAAWAVATRQDLSRHRGDAAVPVINMAVSDVHQMPITLQSEMYLNVTRKKVPTTNSIRYPTVWFHNCFLDYHIFVFFYHILFGLTVDLMLRLTNREPQLMKVYRRIEAVNNALSYFVFRHFKIDTHKLWRLQVLMHPDDEAAFSYGVERFEPSDYSVTQLTGVLQYALKEKLDPEPGLRHIRRLFWMEVAFYVLLALALIYFFKPFSYAF